MDKLNQLQEKQKSLFDTLIKSRGKELDDNYKAIRGQIKQVEQEITEEKARLKLIKFNRDQARKRELAIQVWEFETPTKDIVNQDGSLHATKVKKYPKIAAASAGRFVGLKFEGDILDRIKFVEDFYMYDRTKNARHETFEDFLKANHIQGKDLEYDEFLTLTENLKKLNESIDKAIEDYKKGLHSLNAHFYYMEGLFTQSNTYLYQTEFRP